MTELYKQQNKNNRKKHIRTVVSIGVDVAAKTDDQICLKYF